MGEDTQQDQRPDDLIDVIRFLLSVIKAVIVSAQDGRIGLSDAFHFWEALKDLAPAIQGFENIKNEISNLTPEQMKHIENFIKTEFDIPNDKIEHYIELVLTTAIHVIDLVSPFVGEKKS